MDLDKIFNSLNDDDFNHEESLKLVEEWKYTPSYKIGMFKKLISNFKFIKDVFIKNMSGSIKLDEEDMEDAGEFITYSRSWEYIKECDLKDEEWVKALTYGSDVHLITSLKLSLNYFESKEEYENCILLKEILDFLNLNLDIQE